MEIQRVIGTNAVVENPFVNHDRSADEVGACIVSRDIFVKLALLGS